MDDEHLALSPPATPPLTEADYEAIFAAVMETARGRWFLAEFAKRNRNADTEQVLRAIDRVEALWQERRPVPPAERVRFDLFEMANAIARTRAEIASIRPDVDSKGKLSEASEELDSIVHTTEQATSEILAAAEQVQEVAWTLREHGADTAACDDLDRRATDIYSACSFQDLTGQRTRKVVDVLRFLEARIKAMIEIWGEAAPSPAEAGAAAPLWLGESNAASQLDQPEIDQIMPAASRAAAPESPSRPVSTSDHHASLAGVAAVATPPASAPPASRVSPVVPDLGTPVAHDDAAARYENPAFPDPGAAPAVVIGSTAVALEHTLLDIVRTPPVSEPETAAPAAETRVDPAAVLKRILALIHVPDETPDTTGADPAIEREPTESQEEPQHEVAAARATGSAAISPQAGERAEPPAIEPQQGEDDGIADDILMPAPQAALLRGAGPSGRSFEAPPASAPEAASQSAAAPNYPAEAPVADAPDAARPIASDVWTWPRAIDAPEDVVAAARTLGIETHSEMPQPTRAEATSAFAGPAVADTNEPSSLMSATADRRDNSPSSPTPAGATDSSAEVEAPAPVAQDANIADSPAPAPHIETPRTVAAKASVSRHDALAAITALSDDEKIALFS